MKRTIQFMSKRVADQSRGIIPDLLTGSGMIGETMPYPPLDASNMISQAI
jgi:hypothetical protein